MRGRAIPLSKARRTVCDMLHFASGVPTVPVERRMDLTDLVFARQAMTNRPSWAAIFMKAYARVTMAMPELRRAYVKLPWPHLREYPHSTATLAVERELDGERGVLFARIGDPAEKPLRELHDRVRRYAEAPIHEVRAFRKQLGMARWPSPIRRGLMWLGLNLPSSRSQAFGTFGLSVYSSLGASSLHPLSPLTTTLTYGVIRPREAVPVRIIYDHRVTDGSTIARALAMLEAELLNAILQELRSTDVERRAA